DRLPVAAWRELHARGLERRRRLGSPAGLQEPSGGGVLMALTTPDKAAYAIVRSFIAAGAAEWDAWQDRGGGVWPKTDPSAKRITSTIFQYVSPMAIYIDPVDDNCPLESDRTPDAACAALTFANVFAPANRQRMIDDLDARTPPDVR